VIFLTLNLKTSVCGKVTPIKKHLSRESERKETEKCAQINSKWRKKRIRKQQFQQQPADYVQRNCLSIEVKSAISSPTMNSDHIGSLI
jgi:hypothetical protein